MNKNYRQLITALAFLLIILGGFTLRLAWPLLTGKDIILETRPIDPFDPLRGQYLNINYNISTIPTQQEYAIGDTIYVALQENNGLWQYKSSSKTKPQNTFIKGTITYASNETTNLQYGIEQYFFEQDATINLTKLQVHARVDSNGNARIVELMKDQKPIEIEYKSAAKIS